MKIVDFIERFLFFVNPSLQCSYKRDYGPSTHAVCVFPFKSLIVGWVVNGGLYSHKLVNSPVALFFFCLHGKEYRSDQYEQCSSIDSV